MARKKTALNALLSGGDILHTGGGRSDDEGCGLAQHQGRVGLLKAEVQGGR